MIVAALTACDGSSGGSPSSSPGSTSTSTSVGNTSSSSGPQVPKTELSVTRFGSTSDGLLSVIVRNTGQTTINSARAIIDVKDKNGNTISAVSAPSNTSKGVRCCTIIGLAPNHSYGLYSKIPVARLSSVHSVDVELANQQVTKGSVALPVTSATNAKLTVLGSDHARVDVTVKMAKSVGPYITLQALLDGPSGKFVGVISGGFFCLKAGSERKVHLDFYHPVPEGTTVAAVVSYPLDKATAQLENLRSCS